jgi:ankyrin repeat protein
LFEACQDGDLAKVMHCIEHGADIEYFGYGGIPPLYEAALYKHLEVVKYLVEQNANIEGRNVWSLNTPLLLAVSQKYMPIVKFLIEKNANLEAEEKFGRTALHYACWTFNLEMVKYLVECGANIEAKDKEGLTAIHYSAKGYEYGNLDSKVCT